MITFGAVRDAYPRSRWQAADSDLKDRQLKQKFVLGKTTVKLKIKY